LPTREELEELAVIFRQDILKANRPGLNPKQSFEDLGDESLRFEMQKILLAVIDSRHLSSTAAQALIHEHNLSLKS